jgi:RNA polymerase sigma-70 factor (ECF subfamily)
VPEVKPDSAQTCKLLEQVRQGNRQALDRLLARHQRDLEVFSRVHLDTGLRARLDPSDLVQEVQLETVERIHGFLERRPMPFHLWIRKTAYQRLHHLRKQHRTAARRSVDREVPLPDRSSLLLVRPLIAGGPSPSQQAENRELAERISQAVGELAEADRELLLMRHVEDMPYEEIALLLDLEPATARKRYGRALIRLQKVLVKHDILEKPHE